MNAFTIAATVLLGGFVPLGAVCLRCREIDAAAALQLCGTLATLILLCLAEGFHRGTYFTVAVVSGVVSWTSGLIYARFLGRWL